MAATRTSNSDRFTERIFRQRLIDEALSSYLDWREASALVQRAYRAWSDAGDADPEPAFLAYRAALDQEQRAGDLYAEVCRRAERVLAGRFDFHRLSPQEI